MKNYLKKITTLLAFGLVTISCTKADTPQVSTAGNSTPICTTTNSLFQQLYNPLNTSTFPENLSGYNNAVIHEYTFKVTNPATICSIGYQSQTALATQNYVIEIFDTVSSSIVSTITTTFSSTATSYVALSTPLVLVAGRSYKIKRYGPATVANPNGAGRMVSNNVTGTGNVSFPKTSGNLTITSSDFYTKNSSIIVSANDNNNSLPFIDIVFQ
jgi:hypothetical protein